MKTGTDLHVRYVLAGLLLGIAFAVSDASAQQPFSPAAATRVLEPWQDVAKLVPSLPHTGDRFGISIALDGQTLIVGAQTDLTDAGPGSGSVTFLRATEDGDWDEVTNLIASDARPQDWLGASVAIDGEVAVAGAIGDDRPGGSNSGSAYVFLRDGQGQWAEAAKLSASNAAAADQFGLSVAVNGAYVIVGAPYVNVESANNGAVYVFHRTGEQQWEQVQILTGSSPGVGHFGFSLATDGDTLVVGARASGEVYIYELDGNDGWVETEVLGSTAGLFGHSVAIEGGTIVIGAMTDVVNGYNGAGSAYIYRRDINRQWQFMERITASEPAPASWFGRCVAMRGGVILVGSVRASYFGLMEAGAAYAYRQSVYGQWFQFARLLASDALPSDWLGEGVAVGDGVLLTGAQLALDPVSGYRCGGVYVWELMRHHQETLSDTR